MSPPSWYLRVYVICWDAQGEIDEPLKIVFSLTQNNDSSLSLDINQPIRQWRAAGRLRGSSSRHGGGSEPCIV